MNENDKKVWRNILTVCGEKRVAPEPNFDFPRWVTVRCPECGKTLCEATPGSTIKKLCNRCKEEQVVMVAA